nr:TonB-dependent receptor [Haloferula luteola]
MVVDADQPNSVLPAHFAGNATVIDAETIALSGSRSVADLLAAEGGVRFTSTSGNAADGTAHLRGFGENAASRVLILVDGRPINRADMASASWLEVPIARLERVEILRGSQTARFGDHAVGGVIHLITKQPGSPHTSIEAAAGNDGTSIQRLSHQQPIGQHGLTFDFERNLTDGWRENAGHELESASLRWTTPLLPALEADFGLQWADERGGFPGPLTKDRLLADPRQSIYALYGQADQYFTEQTRWSGDATFTARRDAWTLELPISLHQRDLAWNFGPGFHTDNLLATYRLAPHLAWDTERISLHAGIEAQQDTLDLAQFAEIERIHRTSTSSLERQVFSLHAGGEAEPWDGLHLTGDFRWTRATTDARSKSLIAPKDASLNFQRGNQESNTAMQLGLRWEPTSNTATWLRYDRLYRLPSTDEIASYQGFPLTQPFNDQLRAETGRQFEIGAEWQPGAWTFRTNGFVQWLEGEILYDYHQNLNVNLADTRRAGWETFIGYQSRHWDASIQGTTLKAEFENGPYSGKEIYLVPRHELTATLTCRPIDTFTLQGEFQHVSSSYEGNDFLNTQEKLPGYNIFNLLISYQARPGLSLYCRINNLLDERYSTLKYSGLWYPAAGRQFLLGFRLER